MTTPINYGGPAFPHAHEDYPFPRGMSLRDYFAGQTAVALATPQAIALIGQKRMTAFDLAIACYDFADAMLLARTSNPSVTPNSPPV